ncbi:hypothetical protein TGAM01_v203173 [Trichoderma gamsii]|uniref:Uncharacterized protein n=1 Tax=Trichoderma gamsii TaxID=398673 RepID=A0A2P4ZUT0_9HYPO|nr:hypothetical protein TGAM01_v203173 [Trichoderma gamsii]PON28036.1 hypothetical protein TGAM01_v203173 [Trichoderma gamsii]
MPRRLRWLIPAVRFATESRPSILNSDLDSDQEEKRPDYADIYDALSSIGLLDPGTRRLNEPKLLELSDDIRAHLLEGASLGDSAEIIKRTLRELVIDESGAIPVLDFATIQNARLDKLLSDMLTLGHQQALLPPRSRVDTFMAERLQRLWIARFREKYFSIDQIRHQNLSKSSRLKDIMFNDAATDGWGLWQAEGSETTLSGLESNLQFRPGQYTIRQYGHKQNPKNRLHRIIVTLERIAGQPSMADLAKVPRPSQMDDWVLFEKFEGEMIRQNHGEQSFLDWKVMKAQERMEQQQWRRALEVGAALTTARHARYSYGMRDLGVKQTT